jgi:hypothetical protein
VLGRVQVETEDVQQFGQEVGIRTEREGAHPMGRQTRGHQHLMHGAGRQPQVGGERAHAPAAVMFRLLARPALHFLQDFLTILRRPSRTSCILQAIQNLAGETTAPLTYHNFGNLKGEAICWLACPAAAAKTMRLRNANAWGVDADPAKWFNLAFIVGFSSMAGATLGMPHHNREGRYYK